MINQLAGLEIFPGQEPGPTTMIVGLVHGNEIVGEYALEYIKQQAKLKNHRGTILTLVANINAHQNKVRFIDSDLNRSFLPEKNDTDQERKRAHEIMEYFADQQIDMVFDIHSTPSKSDPMILCSIQEESSSLAKMFPIKYVVKNLINNVEGVSLLQHFVHQGSVGLAFEAGCHEDAETIQLGILIAQKILDIHNNKILENNTDQIVINTTDILYTSDPTFTFSKNYQGFETVKAGEIRGKDSTTPFSFSSDKILMIPNTKFQDDLKKKSRTRLVYFGEQQ